MRKLKKKRSQQETSDLDLQQKLEKARAQREETRLTVPLDQAELTTWRSNADKLSQVELKVDGARTECEKAQGKLASALKAVGGNAKDNAVLTLPDHAELFELLRDTHNHNTRADVLRERLRLLDSIDSSEPDPKERDLLSSAIDALRHWLRAKPPPDPKSKAGSGLDQLPWLHLGIASMVLGAGLAWFVHLAFALLAALGAGIALAAKILDKRSPAEGEETSIDRQAEARIKFENLAIEGPESWEISSVEARLQKLEEKAAELDASKQRARDRDVERELQKNELDGLSEKNAALNARRRELKDKLGLPELPPDAELVDFARALDTLRQTRASHEEAIGKLKQLEDSHGEGLAHLVGFLKRYGEPHPEGATEAKARLNNLAERNSRLKTALGDERSISQQLKRNEIERKETQAAMAKIYLDAELEEGDEQGLVALLQRLPRYGELVEKKRDLEIGLALARNELGRAGEAELTERDAHSLEALKGKLEATASQESRLRDEIADVRNKRKEARTGNKVQGLIAEREEARGNLQHLRDDALFAGAGNFLLREVEEEHGQAQLPRVLKRAGDHFTRFTLRNYKLRLEKDKDTPRLAAEEARSGKVRQLDELSAGTRAQLLLAARIAYTEEVEQGKVMPLFLDEALDQSDPQRFRAIVANLGRLAQDQGRQIFYLTSDPLDVERIRDALDKAGCDIAAEIDLGQIRTGAASVKGPETLRIVPEPPVPHPEGMSPAEYAALLQVPAFRPMLGFAEQHVFYLLWDDLGLLRDLLANGIERGGQWKTVTGTPLAAKLGSGSIEDAQINLRLNLLDNFCEFWKEGRGRPVDRDVLIESQCAF